MFRTQVDEGWPRVLSVFLDFSLNVDKNTDAEMHLLMHIISLKMKQLKFPHFHDENTKLYSSTTFHSHREQTGENNSTETLRVFNNDVGMIFI